MAGAAAETPNFFSKIEIGAGKLLPEVNELLKQLPQNNQQQKDKYNELLAKYQVQMEKISHVIRTSPIELANFINLNSKAKPNNIILVKDKIYAADAAQKTIFSIDRASKLTTSINMTVPAINRLDYPSLDKNNNLYYLDSNKISILDTKSEKISNLDINYNGNLEKITAFKLYNNRFYFVDSAVGQIYRLTRANNLLANSTPWLNSKEDLSKIVSLDIDGDVYLLSSNGEILKYTKGKKQDFSLTAVEPALNKAAKLIISPEQNYLYILDPQNKRLVVFDKTGKFDSQYTSNKFDNLKDFQIDENNKKIYFLNNTTVYSVDMIHQNQ